MSALPAQDLCFIVLRNAPRLRENFEQTSGAKRRLQCTRPVCGLLVPYSTLARFSSAATRARWDELGIASRRVCVCLNDGYHNAANSACRERLQPPNAVVLRLQSVQCCRPAAISPTITSLVRAHAAIPKRCRRNDDDAARCCSAYGARKPSSRPKEHHTPSHCKHWTASWSAASMI